MPLYHYECFTCGHQFTDMLRIANRKIPTENPCSECGADDVRQLIGTTNIGDPVRLGVTRPSSEFNEVIERINDRTPRSNLHQKLSRGRRKKGLSDLSN